MRLVFGLSWLPLLGARPQQEAAQLARQQRASHSVLLGQPPVAVGLLTGRVGSEPLYSAAHCLAVRHSTGSVAACWPLPDGSHWVVAVHEGMVVARSDRCYASAEDAHSMLEELKLAYPRLDVLAPPESAIEAWAALATGAASIPALRRVIRGVRRRRSLVAGVALLLLAGFGQRFITSTPNITSAEVPGSHASEPLQSDTASAGQILSGHRLPGASGLRVALHSLRSLPLLPGGWRLWRAYCTWRDQNWSCQANYRRQAPRTDNIGLQSALASFPWDHDLSFDSLDTAALIWTRPWQGLDLTQAVLSSTADNDRVLASALQALQPLFHRLVLGGPGPVLSQDESAALAGLGVVRRAVTVEGPLRAVDYLLPHADAIGWQRLELLVAPAAVVPAARSSVFNFTMRGVLYERLATDVL